MKNMVRLVVLGSMLVLLTGLHGVARANGSRSGIRPMVGGKIYTKGKMAMGKPLQFEMEIDPSTMEILRADMMHHNKMAPQKTMMCELHVMREHRNVVMLSCTPG